MRAAHHVMFDVDGTLVQSYDFDGDCFVDAVATVLGERPDDDWTRYTHATDAGILAQLIRECGRESEQAALERTVRRRFVANIREHLARQPARPVAGAAAFVAALRGRSDLSLSIATGGWRETARLKLASAGIDVDGIPLATSSDHFARTDIMRRARRLADGDSEHPVTYFGDGEWDREACARLGYNFVLVGTRTRHTQTIADFEDVATALGFLGLDGDAASSA